MNNKIKAFLALALLSAFACTKDNGNYDYTPEADAIVISERMYNNPNGGTYQAFVFKQGETIEISALYTIQDHMITEDDLSFEWLMGDEVVGTDPVLVLDPLPTDRYEGILIITEHIYGMKYSSRFTFQIDPTFTEGWAVLTDDGNTARLNYLTINPNNGEFEWHENVYAEANSGATLAGGSGPMSFHFNGATSHGLSIIQPGAEGPVDLDASNMGLNGKIRENFIAGLPETDFSDIAWKLNTTSVCALNSNGKLYVRDEEVYSTGVFNEVVPFAGKFSGPLVQDDGKDYHISHMVNTSLFSSGMLYTNMVICYDDLNSRCAVIKGTKMIPITLAYYTNGDNEPYMPGDSGWDGKDRLPDIKFAGPENLEGYNVLKMIACGYDMESLAWEMDMSNCGNYPITIVMILEKKEAPGDYYLLVYDLYDPDIDLSVFCKWPEDIPIDPETMLAGNMMGTIGSSRFYFTAEGNRDLYYFDTVFSPTGSKVSFGKVYTSEKELSAFGKGAVSNMISAMMGTPNDSPYQDLVVLGETDGGISIIRVNPVSLIAEKVTELETDFGKVTHIEYMPDASYNF